MRCPVPSTTTVRPSVQQFIGGADEVRSHLRAPGWQTDGRDVGRAGFLQPFRHGQRIAQLSGGRRAWCGGGEIAQQDRSVGVVDLRGEAVREGEQPRSAVSRGSPASPSCGNPVVADGRARRRCRDLVRMGATVPQRESPFHGEWRSGYASPRVTRFRAPGLTFLRHPGSRQVERWGWDVVGSGE
jgi:hypothetical protein